MKKSVKIVFGSLLLMILLFGGCVYLVFRPVVSDYSGATLTDFTRVAGYSANLPASARNIRMVHSSVGLAGRAHIIRFEAPVEDCKKFVAAEYQVYASRKPNNGPKYIEMTKPPIPPVEWDKAYKIRHLEWFDVGSVKHGLELKPDNSHNLHAWIDTERHVLYLYWND